MNLEKAKDILKNCISDYIISEYCSKCGDFQICESKNEDCYFIQAIDTILKSLEEKDKEIIRLGKVSNEYKKAYELETYERQKFIDELDTYKKIAEKLADELGKEYSNSEPCNMESITGIYNCKEKICKQCIIDWAKEDVNK